LPAAAHVEKEGSFTNTQRLLQYHEKAVDPPGDSRSETWFMYHLGRRLKDKAKKNPSPRNAGLNALTWDYPTEGAIREPKVDAVVCEINGYRTDTGNLVSEYTELQDDGSTACGCWIYSGVHPKPGHNISNMRKSHDYLGQGWGFSWPSDRRILYNRASADPDGKPWSERKKLVWWDEEQGRWVGDDVPDFVADRAPGSRPDPELGGAAALAGDDPFIMQADGKGWLFAPKGLLDGPLPTHYEPQES